MITLTGNSEVENEVTLQPLLRITFHDIQALRVQALRVQALRVQSIQSIHNNIQSILNIHFVEHFTFNKLLKYFEKILKKPSKNRFTTHTYKMSNLFDI